MDYEKKYKELVNAARELQKANPSDEGIWNWVNDNFPELAESEEEKIKEEIILYLDWLEGRTICQPKGVYTIRDMIDWIREQGEQKPTNDTDEDIVEAVKDASILDMVEPKDYSSIDPHFFKPTWSEDDEKILNTNISFLSEYAAKGYENAVMCMDWLKSLKQRMFVS